jgi:hypothetical protein
LDPIINSTANRLTGEWEEDEDIKLKNAVHKHGGKDWAAIAALVPGRAANQCCYRWHQVLDPSIDQADVAYNWNEDEDVKLASAVFSCGSKIFKNWLAVAGWVPGRNYIQCRGRWNRLLREKEFAKYLLIPNQRSEDATVNSKDAIINTIINTITRSWLPNAKYANAAAYMKDQSGFR